MNSRSLRGFLATGLRSFEKSALNTRRTSLMHRWTDDLCIRAKVQCFVLSVQYLTSWRSVALNWTQTQKQKFSLDNPCFALTWVSDNSDSLQLTLLHKKFTGCKRSRLTGSWTRRLLILISRVSEHVTADVYHKNMVNNTLGVRASAKRRARFELQTVVDACFSASV